MDRPDADGWNVPLNELFVRAATGRAGGRFARHRRDLLRALLVLVTAGVALVALQESGAARLLPAPLAGPMAGPMAATVPVPPDAAQAPLGQPAPAPAGEGGFAYLSEHRGQPVRFDPCRPVHYVTGSVGAPAGAEQLLFEAVRQVSLATGLVFVYDGGTEEAPADLREPVQPERYGARWAPVLIAWSDEADDPDLRGGTAGYASPVSADPDGRGPRLLTGTVVLDAEQLAGYHDPRVVLTTVLHELGHLVGLGHVDDAADIMHAESGPADGYTAGALRGLHQLGLGDCYS